MNIISPRSYLIQAFYEWINDNQWTPYILVDAEFPGAIVPQQYIEDGKITLNISALAVRKLNITQQAIQFTAKFSGVLMQVVVPIAATLAIYAHENGYGMAFSEDEEFTEEGLGEPEDSSTEKKTPRRGKPHLTIVK